MPAATEFALVPLIEGLDPEDPKSEAHPIFQRTFQLILAQKGVQTLHFGRQVENPNIVGFFIDWDSVEDHKNFIASEVYKTLFEGGEQYIAGAPVMHHTHFDPAPYDAWTKGGVTEVINIYFPLDYSKEDIDLFDSNIKKFYGAVDTDDVKATTAGWAVEEVDIPGTTDKGRLWNGLIAWTSIEAHLAYRETETFKESVPLLGGVKDLKHLNVYHVKTTETKKS